LASLAFGLELRATGAPFGGGASDLAALGLVASPFADSLFAASVLGGWPLEACGFAAWGLVVFGFVASALLVSGLVVSGLVVSGLAGVWADAGNPVVSARLIDKANDKLIDKAVDRKAAARADWVTAFLRGESSIPLSTRSI
jgi:hypothetical protein